MRKSLIKDVLVITMDKRQRCFYPGTIGLHDGRIGYVGRSKPSLRGKSIKPPDRCLALPGFLDGHVHATYLPWRYGGRPGRKDFKDNASPRERLSVIQRVRREAIRAGVTFLADFAPYDDGTLRGHGKTLGLS